MSFSKNKKKFQNGFSIGEVILSAFILAFTLVVLIRVISVSLRDSMDSRDSIIASSLAQEGVELVRNVRDNEWIFLGQGAITSFSRFPSASVSDITKCRIDKTAIAASFSPSFNIPCGDSSGKLLYYLNGYYVHSGTVATKFRRNIILTYSPAGAPSNANTLTVTSMVTWNKTNDTFPAKADCKIGDKCVFTEITLNKWNE